MSVKKRKKLIRKFNATFKQQRVINFAKIYCSIVFAVNEFLKQVREALVI